MGVERLPAGQGGSHTPTDAPGGCEETRSGEGTTHLLATLPVLPLLVAQDRATTLFGGDAFALLERLAEGARTDLAVLVETVDVESMLATRGRSKSTQKHRTRIHRATGSS